MISWSITVRCVLR